MLNLHIQEDSKAQQNQKAVDKISVSRDIRGVKHHKECQGMIQAKVVCFGVQVGFKLLSERSQSGRCTNLIWVSIPHSGSIKSKTITKLFDRFIQQKGTTLE